MTNFKGDAGGWFALPATLEIDNEETLDVEYQRLTALGYSVRATKVRRIVADENDETGDLRQVGLFKVGYLTVERKGNAP